MRRMSFELDFVLPNWFAHCFDRCFWSSEMAFKRKWLVGDAQFWLMLLFVSLKISQISFQIAFGTTNATCCALGWCNFESIAARSWAPQAFTDAAAFIVATEQFKAILIKRQQKYSSRITVKKREEWSKEKNDEAVIWCYVTGCHNCPAWIMSSENSPFKWVNATKQ